MDRYRDLRNELARRRTMEVIRSLGWTRLNLRENQEELCRVEQVPSSLQLLLLLYLEPSLKLRRASSSM